jgi:hypothetical protein
MTSTEDGDERIGTKANTRSAAAGAQEKPCGQWSLEVRPWLLARTELFHMQPKSLCVDKAVVTNHHIEQCNTGLLTRDPVCLSRHNLAAMLALISHNANNSAKEVPPCANGC